MMKKYDRPTRMWVDEAEHERRSKKRKLCKGGREHDFVEVLPFYAEATETYKGNPQPLYDAEDIIAQFERDTYEKLEKEHGIKLRHHRAERLRTWSTYQCSVCGKTKYGSVK